MITGAITIKVETVYGNRLYYPRCDEAKTFAELFPLPPRGSLLTGTGPPVLQVQTNRALVHFYR